MVRLPIEAESQRKNIFFCCFELRGRELHLIKYFITQVHQHVVAMRNGKNFERPVSLANKFQKFSH